jgi:vacuolar-type H+-ATPase subunit I/STV1
VVVTPEVPKGSKTPSENLLAALEQERQKRRELEAQLLEVTTSQPLQETYSDEGKLLERQISSLKNELEAIKEDKTVDALQVQYPELKELSQEFNSYRSDFPSSKIESVAKLFLSEKGLLDKPRKGLEKTTGGQVAPTDGFTADEVMDMRKNNHRKYLDYLMSGKIRLDDLK